MYRDICVLQYVLLFTTLKMNIIHEYKKKIKCENVKKYVRKQNLDGYVYGISVLIKYLCH